MKNPIFGLVNLREHLPVWGDGKPSYWIFYQKEEEGDILKGPMFTHDLDAYSIAEWLVHEGFVQSAWVVAAVSGVIRKRDK